MLSSWPMQICNAGYIRSAGGSGVSRCLYFCRLEDLGGSLRSASCCGNGRLRLPYRPYCAHFPLCSSFRRRLQTCAGRRVCRWSCSCRRWVTSASLVVLLADYFAAHSKHSDRRLCRRYLLRFSSPSCCFSARMRLSKPHPVSASVPLAKSVSFILLRSAAAPPPALCTRTAPVRRRAPRVTASGQPTRWPRCHRPGPRASPPTPGPAGRARTVRRKCAAAPLLAVCCRARPSAAPWCVQHSQTPDCLQ